MFQILVWFCVFISTFASAQNPRQLLKQCPTRSAGSVQSYQRLVKDMRLHMLDRSFQLQTEMLTFYTGNELEYKKQSCDRFELSGKYKHLDKYKDILANRTEEEKRETIKLLVRAVYEIVFIEHVYIKHQITAPRRRNWMQYPFWAAQPMPFIDFPSDYPVDIFTQQIGRPQDRVLLLYEKYPILRYRFGLEGKTVATKLFEMVFGKDILKRLNEDAETDMNQIRNMYSYKETKVKLKNHRGKLIELNKNQSNGLLSLLYYSAITLPVNVKDYVDSIDNLVLKRLSTFINNAYIYWLDKQYYVRGVACNNMDFQIENYSYLLLSLLGKDVDYNIMDVVCSKRWGRSVPRMLEAGIQAAYGGVLVASIVVRRLRKRGVPLAAVMAAVSFAMRFGRVGDALVVERSLMLLDAHTEDHKKYNLLFNALAIPISFWGINSGMKVFSGNGWRALVPFSYGWKDSTWRERIIGLNFFLHLGTSRFTDVKAHIDLGINPLTSKNQWINTWYNIFGGILGNNALVKSGTFGGRVHSAMVMSIAYSIFNAYVQNWFFLLSNDIFSEKNLTYDIMSGALVSNPRNMVDWALFNYLASKATGPVSASIVGAATGVIRNLDNIQRKTQYSNSKLTFIKGERTFLESVFDVRLEDYKYWEFSKKND